MDPQPVISELFQKSDCGFSGNNDVTTGKTEDKSDLCPSFRSSSTKPKVHKSSKASMKKKSSSMYRKAPQAPKRFKPAYICFSMEKHKEIKKELGSKATVGAVSKRISQVWHSLPPNERAHWDEEAEKDKKRYEAEKSVYKGPWKILAKPSKADANAPKRPMSSFLYYAQKYRPIVKKENPELCNTEVSKLLGVMWKNAPEDEKQKYIQHEEAQRAIYNSAISDWHKKRSEATSSVPEYRQETAPNDSGLASSNLPRPYLPHHDNVVGNNKDAEQQQQQQQQQQQHMGMHTYYGQAPASHGMIPPPVPYGNYTLNSQLPPHPSYNGHYEHAHMGYPAHSTSAYSYPPYAGEQYQSYNTQQDYSVHGTQDFSSLNSINPQQDYSVHHPQDYSPHNSSSSPKEYDVLNSAPQQDYSVHSSEAPNASDSHNVYYMPQNEMEGNHYNSHASEYQEYGNDYSNHM